MLSNERSHRPVEDFPWAMGCTRRDLGRNSLSHAQAGRMSRSGGIRPKGGGGQRFSLIFNPGAPFVGEFALCLVMKHTYLCTLLRHKQVRER